MLSNATNQPKSTVELGYMCPDSLVHQQWHSPSSEIQKETSTKMYTPF